MKKLFILIGLMVSLVSSRALTIINISEFPNSSTAGTNWLILFAVPGVTNYNMSILQFENWLANDPVFIGALLANTNLNFNSTSTNWTTQIYGPNYIFTNTVGFYNTNDSFVSLSTYNPSPVFHSELVISNSSATTKITNTLPWNAFSVSLGTNVTQAVIQPSSVLDLKITYYNGIYYLYDYGKNNSSLTSIAGLSGQGGLYFTNGVFFVH